MTGSTGMPPWNAWGTSPATVVVFGGSFDPPHRAHLDLPQRAIRAIGADWLLYVPAAQSPHKQRTPGASGAHRLGMVRAALKGLPRCSVSDLELRRPGPSYTVDTLRALRAIAPHSVTFRLLVGADQALALSAWRVPGEIMELAEPLVMRRDQDESPGALAELLAAGPAPVGGSVEAWRARIVDVGTLDVSSTRVRALLRRGSDPVARRELRRLVPAEVMRYIEAHRLYRGVPGA